MGTMGPSSVALRGVSMRVDSCVPPSPCLGEFPVGWRTLLLLPPGARRSETCAQKAEGARAGGTVTAPARPLSEDAASRWTPTAGLDV